MNSNVIALPREPAAPILKVAPSRFVTIELASEGMQA